MGLIQDDQIRLDVGPVMHGIVKLISKDFGGPDDNRRIRILFSVSRQNPTVFDTEFMAEFQINGIG